jgi:hypothetical protein
MASRASATLIVLVLVQLVIAQSLNLFPNLVAIDFYQYWAVGAARKLSDQPLGSPYKNHREYTTVVRDYAKRTDQAQLTLNGRVLGPFGFTATPFLYVLFGTLPADYPRALVLFHALQLLFFVGAVVLLGVTYRFEMFRAVCLALLLVLGFGPLSSDLRLGNLGSFQLAAFSALLYLASRLRQAPRVILGALLLTGLTLLAIAKPNVALVAVFMALHLWVAHGGRFFVLAALPAVVAAAVAAVAPCLYFGSWTVWQEWYGFVFGRNPSALARPAGGGNYSTALLLARALHVDVWAVAGVLAALLGASAVAVTVASAVRDGGVWHVLRRALDRVFGDPAFAMAIGVTLTLALPHLVWYHYYTIALIPGLWLLNAAGSRALPLCGLAALILISGLLYVLLFPFGWADVGTAGAGLGWIPLWVGALLRLRPDGEEEGGAPAPPAEKTGTPRPAENRTRRRQRGARAPSRT